MLNELGSVRPRTAPDVFDTIVVGYQPNLQDGAGKEFGDAAEDEIVVFKPLCDGKFECIARVAPPGKWTEWAR